jgi:hypothetical protein
MDYSTISKTLGDCMGYVIATTHHVQHTQSKKQEEMDRIEKQSNQARKDRRNYRRDRPLFSEVAYTKQGNGTNKKWITSVLLAHQRAAKSKSRTQRFQ